MNNQHDPLGIYQLTEELRKLREVIVPLLNIQKSPIFLMPEEKVKECLNVSASTLRGWRRSGKIIHSYVKVGNKFFYDVDKLRKEMWENGEQ